MADDRSAEERLFTGRRRVLAEIAAWLQLGEPGLFLLTGSAGCGKSAVLAQVAYLSDPGRRTEAKARGRLQEGDPDPGEHGIQAFVRLGGLTTQQAAAAIAGQLGLPEPRTPAELIAMLAARHPAGARPPALVLDGLDELAAGQISQLVDKVLEPLARIAAVLVSLRRGPSHQGDAPQQAQDAIERLSLGRARVVDLDRDPDTVDDIAAYVRSRMAATGRTGPGAAEAARALAVQIGESGGGFLFARLLTELSSREPERDPYRSPVSELPRSVGAAFETAIDAVPTLRRAGREVPGAGRSLLTALAWGHGGGLPADEVWAAVASAIDGSGETYTRQDVRWALDAFGPYIVEDRPLGAYRLCHQAFEQHLLQNGTAPAADRATAITRALIDLVLRREQGARPPAPAHPYVRRHLAAHAADGGSAGISLVRAAVERDRATFLPILAAALERLAGDLADGGHRSVATAPAEEAVTLYRELAAATPSAGAMLDLTRSLTRLSVRQAQAGDRSTALVTATEAVSLHRRLASTDPAAFLPGLARSLHTLANHLAQAGDRHTALSTATEAVDLQRELATVNPAVYRPELAASLRNLSARQAEAGDRRTALATAVRSVSLYRELAATGVPSYRAGLARSLTNLSIREAQAGDRRTALATATEAVALFRELAAADPVAFRPDLAGALNSLSIRQSQCGAGPTALATAVEAVELRRELVEADRPAFLPDLARSLNNLANRQAQTGDQHAALATATEAATLRRRLAATDPAAFLPDLARTLNNLANSQAQAGDRQTALVTATEAVGLYRSLAATDPAAFLPDLARTLNNLAGHQAGKGDPQTALVTATEAVGLYRSLAAGNPAAFLPDLARTLNNLANRRADTGDQQAALAASTEAVGLYRSLAATDPAAFLPDLARTLNNLANRRADTGDQQAALAASTEAVGLYRSLATGDRPALLPDLAHTLNNLATRLAHAGNHLTAVAMATEAVDLYRSLAATNPAAFIPDLARTLNNLAGHQAETADHRTAVATATEAVGLYRSLAAANAAAFLPDLARTLNNLAGHHAGLGDLGEALAAYDSVQQALHATTGAGGRIAYERASFQLRVGDTASGARALVALVQSGPTGEVLHHTLYLCRARLRALANGSVDGARAVSEAWSRVVGGVEPAWLHLGERTMELADAWLNCPTWHASLAFWATNRAALQTVEVEAALREIALVEPGLADLHLDLLTRSARLGHDAFLPLVLRELAADWMDAPNWLQSQEFLTDHAAELLRPEAVTALGDSTEPEVLVHLALLHIAGESGIPAAYECVEDRAHLHDRVQLTLARADAVSLRHCAALERFVFQDAFPGIAHEMAADILVEGAVLRDAGRRLARAATALDESTRNRTAAEISELARRRPEHGDELGRLLDAVLSAGAVHGPERRSHRSRQVARPA